MFGNHGLCGLLEGGAHEKSPKCLGGTLGDLGEFCKGLGPCAAVTFAVGFAAYSEMLPQGAAVAFVLAEVAVNGAVVERDLVVFVQVGAYLFGAEFATDKGVYVLNQLRIELIGLSLALFDSPALTLGFFSTVLLPL